MHPSPFPLPPRSFDVGQPLQTFDHDQSSVFRVPSASPPPDWVLAERRAMGARVRAAREYAGLTQEALAIDAGTDRPSVVRIEAGQQSPTADTLIRIARVIGVSPARFFE